MDSWFAVTPTAGHPFKQFAKILDFPLDSTAECGSIGVEREREMATDQTINRNLTQKGRCMMTNYLIYCEGEKWRIEDRNRRAVAGSPTNTQAEAERVARNAASCSADVRASRENTRRLLGCDYDPTN